MKCKLYFAVKDPLGFPTPGTLKGYDADPCNCGLVQLENTDTFTGVHGDGHEVVQSFHPQKLRFFVRLDCDGNIIPNSLFSTPKHPGGHVAEFKKTFKVYP